MRFGLPSEGDAPPCESRWRVAPALREQRTYWLPLGETIRPAGEVDDLGKGIEAEAPKESRGEIGGRDGVEVGISAELVAGSINTAAANAAAGKHSAITKRPMIAAGGAVDFGSAAEFAKSDHESRIE